MTTHVHGSPCKNCRSTLRYRNGRSCVNCMKSKDRRTYRAENRKDLKLKNDAWRSINPKRVMVIAARKRAKQDGLPCTITQADIIIPFACPLLNIPMWRGSGRRHHGSPTLDRIVPNLGYVPGNVIVISHRANLIKNDATLTELQILTANLTAIVALRHVHPA